MPPAIQSRTVTPSAALRGVLSVPGDKSISHRLGMLLALARGSSVIRGFLGAEDCLHTLKAMSALGAEIHFETNGDLHIIGRAGRVLQPSGPLDLGNSGTGLRLLAGLLAGHPVDVTLTGDESLRSRPMGRIQEPLTRMGATVDLLGENGRAPVRIRGGNLRGIRYATPVASAQVKSCVLLAGLFAEGPTTVVEPLPTRDHTERLLRALGVPVSVEGSEVTLPGAGPAGPALKGAAWTVPGDFSSAAFWLAGAAARPGSAVTLEGVGLNPRRTALLDVLRRMGAEVRVEPDPVSAAWEPAGRIAVRGARLRGTVVGGAEIPNLIDELPILSAIAALAEGETTIRDAAELRVKESDRVATMAAGLRQLGVEVAERPDGMTVRGPAAVKGCDALRSRGDHRVAMALSILALAADGPSVVHDIACVATSYPAFWEHLERLTAEA